METQSTINLDVALAQLEDRQSRRMNRVDAPWTPAQVYSLNEYQADGYGHPFTGDRGPNNEETVLIATPDGWVAKAGGPVVQTWAHDFMANLDWRLRKHGLWRGAKVRMTEELKKVMRGKCGEAGKHVGPFSQDDGEEPDCYGCSSEHIAEFEDSVGIVQGFADYNNQGEVRDESKVGPEVDVRWQPDNLRYAYDPKYLVVVLDVTTTSPEADQ